MPSQVSTSGEGSSMSPLGSGENESGPRGAWLAEATAISEASAWEPPAVGESGPTAAPMCTKEDWLGTVCIDRGTDAW